MAGEAGGDAFACHRCGTCCTRLDDLWDERAPAGPLAGGRLHRLPTPGGLRVFAWEADPFPRERLAPMIAVADGRRERLVAAAYELDAGTCPNYDPDTGCTIYEERPLVCQAYPLLVTPGQAGLQVEVSGLCPGRVELTEAALDAEAPEQTLARLYPDELPPALAVPAAVTVLEATVDLLASADAIKPVEGLDRDALARWNKRDALDLVDLAEDAGVADATSLRERAEGVRQGFRDRWVEQG